MNGLSVRVGRTDEGILVSLAGYCDELDVVERLLWDLVEGQGNRAVTVAADELDAPEPVDDVLLRIAALAEDRGVRFVLTEPSALDR